MFDNIWTFFFKKFVRYFYFDGTHEGKGQGFREATSGHFLPEEISQFIDVQLQKDITCINIFTVELNQMHLLTH